MSRANPRFRRTNVNLPAPTGNVYRALFMGTFDGQLVQNTFYFQDGVAPAAPFSGNLLSLSTALQLSGGWTTKFLACCATQYTLSQLKIDSPNNPQVAPIFTTILLPGTGASGFEPGPVAAVIWRYTNFKGQCGRGHVQMPAVPTSWVTGSQIIPANYQAGSAYSNFAALFAFSITSGGFTFTPVIYSKGSRGFMTKGAASITSAGTRPVLGTARRRKQGRGK